MNLSRDTDRASSKKVAIYARYSSDLQNVRSIDDQFRVCQERVEREGWTVHEHYMDYALSGSTLVRPGLQRMLQDARDTKVDIVLVESLDRLSRDQADIATIFKHMQFAGIEIITLCEGRVGVLDIGLRGTMNQLFLVDNANRVRRGQLGRIKAGKVMAGLGYGYDVVRRFDASGAAVHGERSINQEQAKIVRRIFEEYAAGQIPFAIVLGLNRDGIPGPTGGEWTRSTVGGSLLRRTGILNNEAYIGQIVWNRHTYIMNPDTGRRVFRRNPETSWVREAVPSLRIVSDSLWNRVKRRQQKIKQDRLNSPRKYELDKRIREHFRDHHPTYLLSGLLKCSCCGGGFVIMRRGGYGCATLANRGTCTNTMRIERRAVENRVLNLLKVFLADDPVKFAAFCEAYARRLKDMRIERNELKTEYLAELTRIEEDYERLTDVPNGAHVGSKLQTDIDRLTARHRIYTRVLARLRDTVDPMEIHYGSYVDNLVDALARNRRHQDSFHAFRAAIGQIDLKPNEGGTELLVEIKGGRPKRRHKPKMERQSPTELKVGEKNYAHAAYFGLDVQYRGERSSGGI